MDHQPPLPCAKGPRSKTSDRTETSKQQTMNVSSAAVVSWREILMKGEDNCSSGEGRDDSKLEVTLNNDTNAAGAKGQVVSETASKYLEVS